ncbi:MAG: type II toxin-antitoxin system VapC family toxin [Deferrisomatales bacterium]|nr:type II toxin-antitoxin system VapC family toxin [Deferrisomatales bacterium]
MIVLDTHAWLWWVQDVAKLSPSQQARMAAEETGGGLGVCAISLWEIAKGVELGKIKLPCPVEEWLALALAYPGVCLLPLTAAIAAESARLPGKFHRDPADQLIVATARILGCPLVTVDGKILSYPHIDHVV